MSKPEVVFAKETDLCAAFIGALPKGWTAYPETGGFDILLVRDADGFQIGIEAKLKLNAKVICQAAEEISFSFVAAEGPDCRAVLIPSYVSRDLAGLLPYVGLTCIAMTPRAPEGSYEYRRGAHFYPHLPESKHAWGDREWFECAPAKRVTLPDWVPDVRAGDSAPLTLTPWKVAAIKLAITLSKRGVLTRQDFSHFKVSMARWRQEKWILLQATGVWTIGPHMPAFERQHPVNYRQIEADYEKWQSPVPAQLNLLATTGA